MIRTIRDRVAAFARELDRLTGSGDLLDDLRSFLNCYPGESFETAQRRQVHEAAAAARCDPDVIEQAQRPEAPRNYVDLRAEEAGDDTAADWQDTAEGIIAMHRAAAREAA